jgi:hypothetical protein
VTHEDATHAAPVRGICNINSQEKNVKPARPHRSHCLSPANAALSKAVSETVPPSHSNVMRLARVIIKPESGRDFVEFLAADNLRVSFSRRRKAICADTTGINGALTNRCRWLTIR